jgi:hypothetical protein
LWFQASLGKKVPETPSQQKKAGHGGAYLLSPKDNGRKYKKKENLSPGQPG